METSKKLLVYAIALASAISIVSVIAVFVLQDVTPLEWLIPSIFGLTSTAYGFYYWKAKAENIRKFGNVDTDDES